MVMCMYVRVCSHARMHVSSFMKLVSLILCLVCCEYCLCGDLCETDFMAVGHFLHLHKFHQLWWDVVWKQGMMCDSTSSVSVFYI
jgi:hypothetical protein